MVPRILKFCAGVFLAIIALAFVSGFWFTVDQRERGIVLLNGAMVGIAEPGMGFKLPFLHRVEKVSIETKVTGFDKMQVYSRDQQPADVSLSVNYRAKETEVGALFSQYGSLDGFVERIIRPKVFEEFKTVFGQYNAVTAIQERARLNADARAAIMRAIAGPVTIENVQIENIDFSDAYERSIEQRMLAEVEVQKLRQNAEREKVEAEIVVTKATAAANATRQSAMAEAEATRLRGDAQAAAIAARGKALRDNPGLVELQAVEKWNGVLPVTMVPGAAVPFVGVK